MRGKQPGATTLAPEREDSCGAELEASYLPLVTDFARPVRGPQAIPRKWVSLRHGTGRPHREQRGPANRRDNGPTF